VRNLFLAGDWTATGWPATMEGACRSGYRAAQACTGKGGIVADIPVAPLARWLGLR
jgi:zeta-carotene desaturase